MAFRVQSTRATPRFVDPPDRMDESESANTGGVSLPGKSYGSGRSLRMRSGTGSQPRKHNIRTTPGHGPPPSHLMPGDKIDLESRAVKKRRVPRQKERTADKNATQIIDTEFEGVKKVKVPPDVRGSMGREGAPISLESEQRRTRTEQGEMVSFYHKAAKQKVKVKLRRKKKEG